MLQQCASAAQQHLPPLFVALQFHAMTVQQEQYVAASLLRLLGGVLWKGALDPHTHSPAQLRGSVVLVCVGGWAHLRPDGVLRGMLHAVFMTAAERENLARSGTSVPGTVAQGTNATHAAAAMAPAHTGLSRSYPSNFIVSTNTAGQPSALWKRGVQFVAMNYQTQDAPMRAYAAAFKGSAAMGFLRTRHTPAAHSKLMHPAAT